LNQTYNWLFDSIASLEVLIDVRQLRASALLSNQIPAFYDYSINFLNGTLFSKIMCHSFNKTKEI
tara:strand:- start:115949 stop:116143 length:195 start_codon:yes stop_codon:yes gene_type:complete